MFKGQPGTAPAQSLKVGSQNLLDTRRDVPIVCGTRNERPQTYSGALPAPGGLGSADARSFESLKSALRCFSCRMK